MAYTTGILRHRVTILNCRTDTGAAWDPRQPYAEWKPCATVWASVDWARGKRAMNAGALDLYGVVIVRMRWNPIVSARSRIEHEGTTYQILGETFHADRQANTIQFHAQALVNEK